jgi:hypothetical protein
MERNGDFIKLTPAGIRAAPRPNRSANVTDAVRNILTEPQRKVFEELLKSSGRAFTRDQLAQRIGWSPESSNIRDRCSELKSLEIIHTPQRGAFALRDWVLGR